MAKEKREYYEEELTEQFIERIGIICLSVYDPHVLMRQDSYAYSIDGNVYEIDVSLQYWKDLLRHEKVGWGYMGTMFELEQKGWKKYFSKDYTLYYLIAPDYVAQVDKLIGDEDVYYVISKWIKLLVDDNDYIYYSRSNGKSYLM